MPRLVPRRKAHPTDQLPVPIAKSYPQS